MRYTVHHSICGFFFSQKLVHKSGFVHKSGDALYLNRSRRRPKKSVPGYARLDKNETKAGSGLHSVTQERIQGRSPVTYGHT